MALKAALEGPTPTRVAVTLLTNSAAANHLKELRRCFASSSKAFVFVAYLGRSGFDEIRRAIEVCLARATTVEFFVGGLDQYITDPHAPRSSTTCFLRGRSQNICISLHQTPAVSTRSSTVSWVQRTGGGHADRRLREYDRRGTLVQLRGVPEAQRSDRT
jgi:hypothetical protein